ncbi:MAG: hypothetical protein ACR2JY_17940 [Chloroflexota bacterium]
MSVDPLFALRLAENSFIKQMRLLDATVAILAANLKQIQGADGYFKEVLLNEQLASVQWNHPSLEVPCPWPCNSPHWWPGKVPTPRVTEG